MHRVPEKWKLISFLQYGCHGFRKAGNMDGNSIAWGHRILNWEQEYFCFKDLKNVKEVGENVGMEWFKRNI